MSQSWDTEPVGLVNGEVRTDSSAVETCDQLNKCTLTFAFGRSFETDSDKDSKDDDEDLQIIYNEYTHHDAFAYVDRIEGGAHDRLVSPSTSVWIRASTVEEADEKPKAMAEWSVFFTLFGCVILFKFIQWYRAYMYKLAINDLKNQQKELQEERDKQE